MKASYSDSDSDPVASHPIPSNVIPRIWCFVGCTLSFRLINYEFESSLSLLLYYEYEYVKLSQLSHNRQWRFAIIIILHVCIIQLQGVSITTNYCTIFRLNVFCYKIKNHKTKARKKKISDVWANAIHHKLQFTEKKQNHNDDLFFKRQT